MKLLNYAACAAVSCMRFLLEKASMDTFFYQKMSVEMSNVKFFNLQFCDVTSVATDSNQENESNFLVFLLVLFINHYT